MKSASISDIKKELKFQTHENLLELCLKLSKYKKDNKEYLNYLLFEAQNEAAFVDSVKQEIDETFENINISTLFFAKKSIRKALRITNKYIKYSGNKQTEVELLIHYCKVFKKCKISIKKYTILNNLYQSQIAKIDKALGTLHEDIQFDFEAQLEEIKNYT